MVGPGSSLQLMPRTSLNQPIVAGTARIYSQPTSISLVLLAGVLQHPVCAGRTQKTKKTRKVRLNRPCEGNAWHVRLEKLIRGNSIDQPPTRHRATDLVAKYSIGLRCCFPGKQGTLASTLNTPYPEVCHSRYTRSHAIFRGKSVRARLNGSRFPRQP